MPTRSFDFFFLPEEMLSGLAEVFGGPSVPSLFSEGVQGGQPLTRTTLDDVIAERPRVLWANASQETPKSFLGLVRVSLPRRKDNMLCMASIAIKVDSGDAQSTVNLKLYERLKVALRRRLRRGLWGVNRKHGGEHFYRNYYISDGAIAEFHSGRELAPEGGDGFVRFEYREGDVAEGERATAR